MFDNEGMIIVSAMEPSDNRGADSVPQSTYLTQVPVDGDHQLVREYKEAFLLIYKVRGQMKELAVGVNSIEPMIDGEAEERPTSILGTEPHMIPGQVLATESNQPMAKPAPPLAGPVSPGMTFTELARRFSKQMEQVVASGKQISAASRQMASGVKELNDGVGMLKRKLSRVKY